MGSRMKHSKSFTLGQSRTADEIKMLQVLNCSSSSSASISWRWWWLWWWLRTSSHWRWRQEQTSHQEGHKVDARWGSKHITFIIKHTKDTMYQTWWSEAANRSCIEFWGWIVVASNFRKFHMVTLWLILCLSFQEFLMVVFSQALRQTKSNQILDHKALTSRPAASKSASSWHAASPSESFLETARKQH